MPLLIAFALVVFALLASIALLPLSLIQRYRIGTSRQFARGWLITLNLAGFGLSTVLFLVGSAITNIWVPKALVYAVAGFCGGCVLGVVGLALTRWERTSQSLYFTPNRWLVLAITLVVTTRILYGFWRSWQSWQSAPDHRSWLIASGVAGSLAAGAVVLGYYLAYWAGVRRRLNRQRRS